MQYTSTPAVSTFVTLDELRAITRFAQQQHKTLTQVVEEAVDLWIAHTAHYGNFEPQPLPNPPRMGLQATLAGDAAAALDHLRAGQYSRAVAVYAALRLWLSQQYAGNATTAA